MEDAFRSCLYSHRWTYFVWICWRTQTSFFPDRIKFAMDSTEETWIALKSPKKPTHCFKIPSVKQQLMKAIGGIMNNLSPTYLPHNSNIAIEKADIKVLFSTAFHPSFCGYKHEIWISMWISMKAVKTCLHWCDLLAQGISQWKMKY